MTANRFSLIDSVAVVAGGTGGIGMHACAVLASAGAQIAVIDRSQERMTLATQVITDNGSSALTLKGDMTSKEDADRVIEEALAHFGHIDILVNAIGGGAGTALYPAESYPRAEWDRILSLNLLSTLLPTQAVAKVMIAAGTGGRILNLSSVRGQLGIDDGYLAYVAAKGAINAITRQLATEWAKYRITVNAISPTFVRTPQVESLLADEEFYQRLIARIPLRRIADPEDLAGAIVFFCSAASAFVTGQVLTVDGGLTATQ